MTGNIGPTPMLDIGPTLLAAHIPYPVLIMFYYI